MNEHLSERFGRSKRGVKGSRGPTQAEVWLLPPKLNTRIREYYEAQPVEGGSWLQRPEFPTSEEILDKDSSSSSSSMIEICPNKPKGAFEDVQDYLSTQYELLREDAIKGLRDAVDRFSFTPAASEDAFQEQMGIYDKVFAFI